MINDYFCNNAKLHEIFKIQIKIGKFPILYLIFLTFVFFVMDNILSTAFKIHVCSRV